MFCPPILTVPVWFSKASVDFILSKNILKGVGDRRPPCLTPLLTWNYSPSFPSTQTALLVFIYSCFMMPMSWLPMLYCLIVANRALCGTMSNAFLKSIKTWKWSLLCCQYFSGNIGRLKICSSVPLAVLYPACSSVSMNPAFVCSLLCRILNMTLLG